MIDKRPDGVLFDWDNTLADGWGSIAEAVNAARAAFSQTPPWTIDEAKRTCTRALRDSFPDWFGADWEKARDIFYDVIHRTHLDRLKATVGADALLRWLDAQGIPLFIVSNKRGDVLRAEVERLGWSGLFRAVIGSTDALIDKPARAPIDLALAGSGLAPETHDLWYVGDKEIDVVCANGARVCWIGLRLCAAQNKCRF
jgi:phosphoglycolate phosphatase